MNGRSPPVSLLEDKGIVSFFCLISLTPQTLPWTWCVLRNIDCGPQIRKKKNALYLFRQEVGGNSSLHESDRQIRGYVRHWREPVIWDSNPGRERLQPHPCRLQVQILEVWVLYFSLGWPGLCMLRKSRWSLPCSSCGLRRKHVQYKHSVRPYLHLERGASLSLPSLHLLVSPPRAC